MPCALIQPDFAYVKNWAELHNVKIIDSPKEIAANPAVKSRIEKEIEKKPASWKMGTDQEN
jgi:long-chain acyl-CoA synthetase